jgi:exopolyphosphatase / guanosine-5'-triphosphate,3'-diphosphate pyrophosphatase
VAELSKPKRTHTPTFAAVDIGANSVRLKIARLARQRLTVIHEDREVTRLGESVFRTGALDPQAMARTMQVLRRFHRAAQTQGADFVRVVATSALRDARNARAFVDWVRSSTGWTVEVISGLEEGRLIHLALMSGTRVTPYRVLLIDLGGGSCELTVSEQGQIKQMFSLPLGAVRLTQEFLHHDPPKHKELERMREYIAEEVGRAEKRITTGHVQITVATSGTAAALAGLQRSRVKNVNTVPRLAVQKAARELSRTTLQERRGLPGIGPRRAEIIIAGANVFSELLTRLRLPSFRFSPLGLRDGVLAQMVADYDRQTRFRQQIESQRRSALVEAGKHFGVDLKFAERVRDLAAALFSGLKVVHGLPPEYADWLAAAGMLQEVGSYINRAGRRRHAYYIISHYELFGYTLHQRQLIAAIARYVGKSRPTADSRPVHPLSTTERNMVQKAVVLLRVARALEQGRRGAVKTVKVQVQPGKVTLRLVTGRGGADLELWALEKERNYFRDVFGRELLAVVS